jgi:hypothetical protein
MTLNRSKLNPIIDTDEIFPMIDLSSQTERAYIQIIDDVFPKEVIEEIDYHLSNNYMFQFGHSGKGKYEGDSLFYVADMYHINGTAYKIIEDPVVSFIRESGCALFGIRVAEYEREYVNLHTVRHDGGWHKDIGNLGDKDFLDIAPDTYTMLYMPNLNPNKCSGQFEIQLPDGEELSIDYVPGRMLLFRSELWHRGTASTALGAVRTTLAFKCMRIFSDELPSDEN